MIPTKEELYRGVQRLKYKVKELIVRMGERAMVRAGDIANGRVVMVRVGEWAIERVGEEI